MTRLYWHYLSKHEKTLSQLHRMQIVLASMRKRPQAEKDLDLQVYQDTLMRLGVSAANV
jgi:deoxyribodipyrimidine photolyase-like uncharacterized protein